MVKVKIAKSEKSRKSKNDGDASRGGDIAKSGKGGESGQGGESGESASGAHRWLAKLTAQGIYPERVCVMTLQAESLTQKKRFVPRPLERALANQESEALCLDRAILAPDLELTLGPVVYWMTANRRLADNAALAVAMSLANALQRPLHIIESLAATVPWACVRHHTFILQGVAERLQVRIPGYEFIGLGHDPAIDPLARLNFFPRHGEGLPLERVFEAPIVSPLNMVENGTLLTERLVGAAAVVTDWQPNFIFPSIVMRALAKVRQEGEECKKPFLVVDDSGLVPVFRYAKVEAAARFLRPKLAPYLESAGVEFKAIEKLCAPLLRSASIPQRGALKRNPSSTPRTPPSGNDLNPKFAAEGFIATELARSRVSAEVGRVATPGGEMAALHALEQFVSLRLLPYSEARNHPDKQGTSRLSPYLHFGMLGPRSVVKRVLEVAQIQNPSDLHKGHGPQVFLDELVTWRELGLNMAHFAFEAGIALGDVGLIPPWARKTLEIHQALSARAETVDLATLEAAQSPDPLWNATQRELLQTGVIHNYMRMIWGKGIVRWSKSPEEALMRMEYLNNKYAIDGRDSNSYLGFYWCLGKFDRPWPPARPPFGIVRSMSTKAAAKKLELGQYLMRFGKER